MSQKKHQKPIIFDSLGQASAHLHVPVSLLKKAKRSGAPGFYHHRIHKDELTPWLKKHGKELASPSEKEQLQIRRLKAQCGMLENQLAEYRRQFVSRAEGARTLQFLAEGERRIFDAMEDEWPPKLAGLSAPEIRTRLKTLNDELFAKMVGRFNSPPGP